MGGVFVMMFTFSRCYLWPMYIRNLYVEALSKSTTYHMVGALLETGLFLTNLHFLWTNIAPIWRTGRLMPKKPRLPQGVAQQAPFFLQGSELCGLKGQDRLEPQRQLQQYGVPERERE